MTEDGVRLSRTASGLVVSVANGDEQLISLELIERSNVLSTVYASCAGGESAQLEVSETLLRAWLNIVNGVHPDEGTDGLLDVSEQLRMVQAADLLDDPMALSQACSLLASRAFPLVCYDKDEPADEVQQQQAAVATEVVEALPEHLAILTLRAALAAVPPRMTGAGWQSTPPRHSRHVQAWLSMLPEHLQPLLLRTFDPSVDACRGLSIELDDLATADSVTEAIARSFAAGLTSLSLQNCDFPFNVTSDGRVVHGRSDEGKAAIRRAIAPVATMTALQRLHLEVWPSEKSRAWADSFFVCVGEALPHLPQLTRLRMSAEGGESSLASAAALLQTTTLRMLRSLDLKGYGLMGQGAAVQRLAAALPKLTTLTHLSLSTNPITSDGWRILSPALAPLPLKSLNLYNCLFDYTCRILPGEPDPENPAFPELETLNLSRNQWSIGTREAAVFLPKLKCLLMTEGRLPEDEERSLLRSMAFEPAPRLREFRFGTVAMQPDSLHALCRCLQRWQGLQALVVQCEAVVPDLLNVLPHLCELRELRELELQCFSVDSGEVLGSLGQLTGLTRLRLGYVMCGHDVVCAFKDSLCALTALQELEIAYVAKEFCAETGVVWARAVSPLTQLTRLSLRCCCLGRAGTRQLAQALACMPEMRELELEQNRMKAKAVAALAPTLGTLSVLSVLCLGSNPVGDSGVAALAEVLPRMQAMRQLDMKECAVGDEGIERVTRAAPQGMREILFMAETKQTVY